MATVIAMLVFCSVGMQGHQQLLCHVSSLNGYTPSYSCELEEMGHASVLGALLLLELVIRWCLKSGHSVWG